MKIAIIGGHGKIALHLTQRLTDAGHAVSNFARNPAHSRNIEAHGGSLVLFDIESGSLAALAGLLEGQDAVVFAAGAGPGSGPERKWSVDRDGAMLTADAAEIAGVRRLIVISAIAADTAAPDAPEVFQVYLRAKSEADASVRARDIDWTIVRPGPLTDGPATGLVEVAKTTARREISRSDVAEVLAQLVTTGAAARRQFEVVGGTTPVADAIANLQ